MNWSKCVKVEIDHYGCECLLGYELETKINRSLFNVQRDMLDLPQIASVMQELKIKNGAILDMKRELVVQQQLVAELQVSLKERDKTLETFKKLSKKSKPNPTIVGQENLHDHNLISTTPKKKNPFKRILSKSLTPSDQQKTFHDASTSKIPKPSGNFKPKRTDNIHGSQIPKMLPRKRTVEPSRKVLVPLDVNKFPS